jgi:eukaryotic-like serine/threonine-protein kinase
MGAVGPDVRSIFGQALEIESQAERSAFLSKACAANPGLRTEVEDLLKAIGDAGEFMNAPAALASRTTPFAPLVEKPGTKIGPYKLLQQIGEGGMGVVYMAEQEEPVRRKVALKIIKPGMDSSQVVARFEAERQALAMMDHQNIARVLDAGTTETGRPYFVMELVHGVPITDYCDANQLTPRERLELFIPVCQAIQHAHQKGIIHRDVKPSNVLVTMYDDRPVPKVIDFGVAKAVEQRLTERTLFTQYGALVGTFEYMSPEQAEMNAFGVDTRSDVFSLGVLLYELLTGTTPLEKVRLREAALGELVRLIKEEEPPRPSVRLSGSGDLPKIAAARKTEPARLSKLVRGEVDWIVMKCLEKDRTRRYETANALARDVERHLRDEPVEACPPSSGYRFRKFARKHRKAVATVSVFVLMLGVMKAIAIALAVMAWKAEARAREQANRAMQAERQAHDERDKAVDAERVAMDARAEAETKRIDAETSRHALRRSLYASEIVLLQKATDSGGLLRLHDLMEREGPRPTDDDLHGFEWHYLRRQASAVRKVKLRTANGVMNRDGTRYVLRRGYRTPEETARHDVELELWDIASGRLLRSFVPFPGRTAFSVYPPRFLSPDGKRMVYSGDARDPAGQSQHRLVGWDWESGRELFAISDLKGRLGVCGPMFDANASRLAFFVNRPGKATGDLIVLEVDGGKELFKVPLADPRANFAISPDGKQVAALTPPHGNGDARTAGELGVWDVASGNQILRLPAEDNWSFHAFTPDGSRLLMKIGDESFRILDAKSGERFLELKGGKLLDLGYLTCKWPFSVVGNRLAGLSRDRKLLIWDVSPGDQATIREPIRVIETNEIGASDFGFSPDGRTISVADVGTIATFEVAPREDRTITTGPENTARVYPTVSADASRFAGAFEAERKAEIKVWDSAGRVLFTTSDVPPEAGRPRDRDVWLNRDGTRLAYWATDQGTIERGQVQFLSRIRVWDIASGRELFRRDERGGRLVFLDFSSDGRLLATKHDIPPPGFSGAIIWNLDTGKEHSRLDGSDQSVRVWFSPDGRQLAGGGLFGMGDNRIREIRIWEMTTGKVTQSRKLPEFSVQRVAYSSDGRMLAFALREGLVASGIIKVLDASSGQEQYSLSGQRYQVSDLAFSPDGRRLASCSDPSDRAASEIKLWDMTVGRELLTLSARDVGRLVFSADGHRLFHIAGGRHKEAQVQVWDGSPLPADRTEDRR